MSESLLMNCSIDREVYEENINQEIARYSGFAGSYTSLQHESNANLNRANLEIRVRIQVRQQYLTLALPDIVLSR